MFESLALENPKNTRRRWTTAASFVLEGLAVGALILAPLGYTEAISLKVDKLPPVPVGRFTNVETHARPEPTEHTSRPQTDFRDGILLQPQRIPTRTDYRPDPRTNVTDDYNGPFVPGATGTPNGDPKFNQLFATNHRPEIAGPPTLTQRRLPISHLDPGMLIRQVQPIYPKMALIAHVEGTVILAAIIDTQGRITGLRALSGHPLLIPAAISAVQQWRYKPYILNGQAVEVETQVSVVFNLQH